MDPVYDFASIRARGIIDLLRQLACQSVRHVLAGGPKPDLTAQQARLLSPVVLSPRYGKFARRRAAALLRRPLRLSVANGSQPSFGPLELVAATAALGREGRLSSLLSGFRRSGVDSGASILSVLARIAFAEPALQETLSVIAHARLADEVVLHPPIELPISFGDTDLLELIALTVPRNKLLPAFSIIRRVENGLIAGAIERRSALVRTGYDAWLIAEAAEAFLARPHMPNRRIVRLWRRIDASALVKGAAESGLARSVRFRRLAAWRPATAEERSAADDGNTSIALRSYLDCHLFPATGEAGRRQEGKQSVDVQE
jgi:hypothetical protein